MMTVCQGGTAHIRRKIKNGKIYTECFVDELNEFYRGGFSVFDANKNEDFRLRLKLYCTVCDWPGYSHHRKFSTCTFSLHFRPVWNARIQPAGQCACLLSLLVHWKEIPWPEANGISRVVYIMLHNV
jgi:hypothetical protein